MSVIVATATKNEGATAEEFYRRLGDFHVITVDDTDEPGDRTKFWAQHNPKHELVRGNKAGIAAAYKKAMLMAASRQYPYEYVMQIDAGLSHLPEFVDLMVRFAGIHGYDLVLGTRTFGQKNDFRSMVSKTAAWLTKFPDATCGMRLWRARYVAPAFGRITSKGNAFQLETLAYAKRANLKIGVFDIPYIRTNSHFRMWMLLEAAKVYYKEFWTW